MSVSQNSRKSRRKTAESPVKPVPEPNPRDGWIVGSIVIVLLAFGIFKAIVLWGAYPIPNPDFPGFIAAGKSLLAFQLPDNFKRAPAVGIFQVLLSRVLPVDNPELTAGWLLNAILSVFNGILLFSLGRRFLGNMAAIVAIVAMLNPWVLVAQVDPVAETTMLFFIFLSFWLMMRRSHWAYLTASIASMVRYECAALIAIAFVLDWLNGTSRRQKGGAVRGAAAASIPFLLWMLGTWMYWNPTASHYLKHYGHGNCIGEYLTCLSKSGFLFLFQWPPAVSAGFFPRSSSVPAFVIQQSVQVVSYVVLTAAGIGVTASLVFSVLRRNAILLAMWAFVLLYLPVHLFRAETQYRYTVPIVGLLLLLCCIGWKDLLERFGRVSLPRWIRVAFPIFLIIVAMVWLINLVEILPGVNKWYLKGRWLPWAGLTAIAAIWILEWIHQKWAGALRNLALSCLSAVAVVSVQFPAVSVIGNGSRVEFKRLADWFLANSKPGERLADRYAGTLRLIAPSRGDDFINMSRDLQSQTLEQFYEKCYNLNVRYVAWSPRGSAGSKRGLEVVGKILTEPRDQGPLRFVRRIEVGPGHWINIFCLARPDEMILSPPGL